MREWMIVPYDGSPAARATLRRAASVAVLASGLYQGLLIATVGLEPSTLDGPVAEAIRTAGPETPVEVYWLSPADPIGSLHCLLERAPAITLAVPLGGHGWAPWYAKACRLGDVAAKTMIFFLTPRELRAAAARRRVTPRPLRASGLPAALHRALARLIPSHLPTHLHQHAKDRP